MYFLYRYKDKTAYYDSSGLYGERKKEVNRKKTIWILIVVLILDVIGIVFFFQMHRRTYSLDLPQAETLGNVVISTDTTKEEIPADHFDVVVEAVGLPATQEQALPAAANGKEKLPRPENKSSTFCPA